MNNEYALLGWCILAIFGGSALAFGPPKLMRWYDETKNPESQSFLISWNRFGGFLFIIIGNIMLLVTIYLANTKHSIKIIVLSIIVLGIESFMFYKLIRKYEQKS